MTGNPMTNDEILAAMRTDMERRGLMESSITKRDISVRAFMRWLGDETSVLTATREQIDQFLDGRHIGPRTRFTWLANLHSFYVWAIADGHAVEDPTEKIVRPKLRRTLPRPAPTDELRHLIDVAPPKERCWVVLAAFQGLRCQEIAGLRREDVSETDGLLRVVHGKGGHERMLPLHPQARAALLALPMPRVGWVFTRARGGKYSANALSTYFNRFLHDNGVASTAHQLRHWFGTQLYQATADLRLTQEMLGHSDPGTTAVYTAFNRRAAAAAIRDLSFGQAAIPDPGPDVAA